MSDQQRSQLYQNRLLQFGGGIARWFIRALFAPAVGADGAIHLFVSTTGNDALNSGLSAGSALRTVQAGVDLAAAYLAQNLDVDVVLEIAAGTYTEDVVCNIPIAMKRRLVIRGPRDTMTVVASGVAGVGTNAYQIADPTAVLVAGANRGLLVHIFDPLNRAASESWRTIEDNSVTVIQLPEPTNGTGGPAAAPGWTWEIVRPSAILNGLGGGANAALSVIMPWASNLAPAVSQNELPSAILQWLQINNADGGVNPSSVRVQGGTIGILGCVFEGVFGGLYLKNATCWSGGDVGFVADPVLQALTGVMLANACLGVKPTNAAAAGVRMEGSRAFFEVLVSTATVGVVVDRQSEIQWISGLCHTGRLQNLRGSQVIGLGAGAGNSNTPLLFSGQSAAAPAIVNNLDCVLNIAGPVHFGAAIGGGAAPAGGCIQSNNESLVRLPGQLDSASTPSLATSIITSLATLLTALDAQNRGGIQTGKETGLSMVIGRGGVYPITVGGTLFLTINTIVVPGIVIAIGDTLAVIVGKILAATAPALGIGFAVASELQLRSYTPAVAYNAGVGVAAPGGYAGLGVFGIITIGADPVLAELGLVAGTTTNGLVGSGATPEGRADALGGTYTALTVAAPLVGPNSDARLWRQQNVI